jgi:inner membrane protein COX18
MIPRLSRPASRFLAVRPPSLYYTRHGVRHHSIAAVAAECSGIADYLALVPVTIFHTVHDTGLPWFAAIPISAVVIRSLITYPLFQRPLRNTMVDRAQIQPLVDAHLAREVRDPMFQSHSPMMKKLNIISKARSKRIQLQAAMFNRSLGGHRIMMFLVTIMASDAFRRLSGAREGLLKLLLGPLEWTVGWLKPVIDRLSNLGALDSSPVELSEESKLVESAWFDPTLTTEGFSWCSDLTAADPTLVLPVLFSTTFFASIYFSPRISGGAADGEATIWQRIGMTVAMLSIIPALQMPAGLLLYFITNFATNNLQARWLAFTRPIIAAPTACKRPITMQRSREFAEDLLPRRKKPSGR